MKSVLYVGVGVPWRGGAGYLVRQNMFLQALAEVADVTLALFDCDAGVERPAFAAGILPLERPFELPTNRLKNLRDDLFSPLPRMHRGDCCDKPISQISGLKVDKFDAVFGYRIDFSRFAGVLNHPRLILDVDDPEHLRQADKVKAFDGGKIDWRSRWDLEKLRRYELNAVKRAKAAFVCQPVDATAFYPHPVFIVPNCVEVPEINYTKSEIQTLVFVGNMSGGEGSPNGDAAKNFVEKVWPLIRSRCPSCKCLLVGGIEDGLRGEFSRVAGVEVLGFVEDLKAIYACRPVCIAPVRYGTGTRIKILEAMAYGCPVVSTSKGCEGIEITENKEIIVADLEADFADACVSLLGDFSRQERLGNAGKDLILRSYSRRHQHEKLVNLISKIMS
ncbi:MAG TPA: glycosyltransferase [Halomicronema sp.]